MAKPIGTLGTVPTITIAGRTIIDTGTTNTGTFRILSGYLTGANTTSTPRDGTTNGGNGYAPSAGLQFYVKAVQAIVASAPPATSLGYNDVDLTISGSTSPTNPIYAGSHSSTNSPIGTMVGEGVSASLSGGGRCGVALAFTVIAEKYIFLSNAGTVATYHVFGYEQA